MTTPTTPAPVTREQARQAFVRLTDNVCANGYMRADDVEIVAAFLDNAQPDAAPCAVPDGWREVLHDVRESIDCGSDTKQNAWTREVVGPYLDRVADELGSLESERLNPAPAASEGHVARDTDWVLAIGEALGMNSGFRVPIIPQPEPFRELFAAIRRAASESKGAALPEPAFYAGFRDGAYTHGPLYTELQLLTYGKERADRARTTLAQQSPAAVAPGGGEVARSEKAASLKGKYRDTLPSSETHLAMRAADEATPPPPADDAVERACTVLYDEQGAPICTWADLSNPASENYAGEEFCNGVRGHMRRLLTAAGYDELRASLDSVEQRLGETLYQGLQLRAQRDRAEAEVSKLIESRDAYKRDAESLLALTKGAADALEKVERERDELRQRVDKHEEVTKAARAYTRIRSRGKEDGMLLAAMGVALANLDAALRAQARGG